MALLDKLARLASDQAVTVTAVTTDSFPLMKAGRNIGAGKQTLGIRFTVKVAAAVAGTENYTFQAVSATASNGTTNQQLLGQSALYAVSSGEIAAGSLAAGQTVTVPIPPDRISATATHIAGRLLTANSAAITVDADLVALDETDSWKAYPAAITAI